MVVTTKMLQSGLCRIWDTSRVWYGRGAAKTVGGYGSARRQARRKDAADPLGYPLTVPRLRCYHTRPSSPGVVGGAAGSTTMLLLMHDAVLREHRLNDDRGGSNLLSRQGL